MGSGAKLMSVMGIGAKGGQSQGQTQGGSNAAGGKDSGQAQAGNKGGGKEEGGGDFFMTIKGGIHNNLMALGLINLKKLGTEIFAAGAAKVTNAIRKRLTPKVKFKLGNEEHQLWVEKGQNRNVVMMASDEKPLEDQIKAGKVPNNGEIINSVNEAEDLKNEKIVNSKLEKVKLKVESSTEVSENKVIKNWKGEIVKIPKGHKMSPVDPDFSVPPIYDPGPFTTKQLEQFSKGNSAGTKLAPHHRHQIPVRDGGVIDEIPGYGHPAGHQHTKGNRHQADSVFNNEPGRNNLRTREIYHAWTSKGKRLKQSGADEWYDPGF